MTKNPAHKHVRGIFLFATRFHTLPQWRGQGSWLQPWIRYPRGALGGSRYPKEETEYLGCSSQKPHQLCAATGGWRAGISL